MMAMPSRTTFSTWLIDKYHDWAKEEHRRTGRDPSMTDFAAWLGVKQPTLAAWANGRYVPSDPDVLKSLAAKLGNGVYGALGMLPPGGRERAILDILGRLSEDEKAEAVRLLRELERGRVDTDINAGGLNGE